MVDGIWNALGAVTWAATEARLRGVALHVLHAAAGAMTGTTHVQDVLGRGYAPARLAESDLPVTTAHADNAPGAALLVAAQHAGLLVVGMTDRDRTKSCSSARSRSSCDLVALECRAAAEVAAQRLRTWAATASDATAAIGLAMAAAADPCGVPELGRVADQR